MYVLRRLQQCRLPLVTQWIRPGAFRWAFCSSIDVDDPLALTAHYVMLFRLSPIQIQCIHDLRTEIQSYFFGLTKYERAW